jgi:hypothetical protein
MVGTIHHIRRAMLDLQYRAEETCDMQRGFTDDIAPMVTRSRLWRGDDHAIGQDNDRDVTPLGSRGLCGRHSAVTGHQETCA